MDILNHEEMTDVVFEREDAAMPLYTLCTVATAMCTVRVQQV